MNIFTLIGNAIISNVGFRPILRGIANGEQNDDAATVSQVNSVSSEIPSAIAEITPPSTLGTPGTGVSVAHEGTTKQYVTTLTLTDIEFAVAAEADEAIGALIYTLPTGAQYVEVSLMSVSLQGTEVTSADTPEVGLGTETASGAVATLAGTAAFEDIITGQVADDCDGSTTEAFFEPDNKLSKAIDEKGVYLNIAGAWSGEDTILASGTVVVKWTQMS